MLICQKQPSLLKLSYIWKKERERERERERKGERERKINGERWRVV